MDVNLIKNVVHTFCVDNKLNGILNETELNDFLLKSLRSVREEDRDFYEELYSLPKSQQISILTERLNMEVIPKYFDLYGTVVQKSNDIVCEEIGKKEYYDPEDNFIYEDLTVMSENILSSAKDLAIGAGKTATSLVKNVVSAAFKTTKALAPLLAVGATTIGVGTYISIPISLFFVAAWSMLKALDYGPYTIAEKLGLTSSKELIEVIGNVSDFIMKLSDSIKDTSEKYKYKFILTMKNEEKCYKKAGIDPQKISLKFFNNIDKLGDDNDDLKTSDNKKLEDLRNCYLENFVERVGIFFDMYFDCLKNTGNWTKVSQYSDDKFLQMIRARGTFFTICDKYKKNALDALKTYEKLIKLMFPSESDRSKWDLVMTRYILEKRTIKMQQSDSRQEKSPFNNSKFNKYGKDLYK